jgi:hypothetical protein
MPFEFWLALADAAVGGKHYRNHLARSNWTGMHPAGNVPDTRGEGGLDLGLYQPALTLPHQQPAH